MSTAASTKLASPPSRSYPPKPNDKKSTGWIADLHGHGIPWRYFLIDKRPTVQHVQQVFGEDLLDRTVEQLQELKEYVQAEKTDATSWGNVEVSHMIATHLVNQGLPNCATWAQVKKWWSKKENGTVKNAKIMWRACFGSFDDLGGDWATRLETQYMKSKQWRYNVQNPSKNIRKGCFAMLFARCKVDKIKEINRWGNKTHGFEIILKRTKEDLEKTSKWKKRKKGQVICAFARKGKQTFTFAEEEDSGGDDEEGGDEDQVSESVEAAAN